VPKQTGVYDRRRIGLAAARRRSAVQKAWFRPDPMASRSRANGVSSNGSEEPSPTNNRRPNTADQLAALSKVPKDIVAQLAMFGLTSSREAGSIASGISARRGKSRASSPKASRFRSLHEASTMSASGSPTRAYPLASLSRVLRQDPGRSDQRPYRQDRPDVLSVNQQEDPDALFQQAQAAEDEGDSASAERTVSPRHEPRPR